MIESKPPKTPIFVQRPETYVGSAKANPVKDVYSFIASILEQSSFEFQDALDVGCATGDFVAFLSKSYALNRITGVDVDEGLLSIARSRANLPSDCFIQADVRNLELGKFDLVTMLGVLGAFGFDNYTNVLSNLVDATRQNGKILIQALFNPDDIDVQVVYRDNLNKQDWRSGFNIFSREPILDWCHERGLTCRFHDFRMTTYLPKNEAQPHRAFTLDTIDGSRRTTNGLCQLLPEAILEIDVPA